MSLAAVRKVALSGFLFPRHTMPMLTKPLYRPGAPQIDMPTPAYHEVCGFTRMSGDYGGMFDRPDLLDVLRAPRRDGYGKEVDQTHAKRPRDWWNTV